MASEWDFFHNPEETSNPSSLFYGLDISSLQPSDGLLIDPALENPNLTDTGPLVWDLPEKEQADSSNQEHGLEIKALHSPSSQQALNDLRSEFRKLIDEQEIRWEKKFQALEQQTRSEIRALGQEIRSEIQARLQEILSELQAQVQEIRSEIQTLAQKVDKIKIEFESELVKFCTEIDAYIKKLRAWATEAKLCVDKVVELQTD